MTTVPLKSGNSIFLARRGERGPILLLLHGFPLDHAMWTFQAELASDFQIWMPDLRGFGKSTVTPGSVTMERFADDLAELLDAVGVGEPVVLGGLSMGGYVAWQFWERHREKVSRLVLCDTRAAADTAEVARARRLTASRVLREGPAFLADTMIEKLFAPASLRAAPDSVAAARRMIESAPPEGVAAALHGMAERADMSGVLGKIDVPALVLCGAEDAITPVDEMRTLAAAMPDAEFVVVPRAGHLAPLENHPFLNAAVRDFLR